MAFRSRHYLICSFCSLIGSWYANWYEHCGIFIATLLLVIPFEAAAFTSAQNGL